MDEGAYRLHEPVAVIGMACRLPGGVRSPGELWKLLMDRRDLVREGPFDRWDVDAFYDPDREVPGRSRTRWAATLDDIAGFDAAFFGISPAEAASMDPQHRLLLEASWEALEYAGIPPRAVTGTRGGVFVGIWSTDNAVRLGGHYDRIDAYAATIGNVHSTAAGRVSYTLGLHGPCVAIDTACSSSLVATHLAIQSLQAGESDFALAGGVNVMLSPEFMISGTRWGMFSPTGRCHAFDERADGLVRGEGVGLVVLKRLADARRDGDRVLAVVRGSAINQDGRSQGLVAPAEDAQRAVYQEAVRRAGIDPGQVGLVETHGPGTPVGDPIEFRALTPVYGTGQGRCALGSVKSNIGHLESASGIAGFIKAVLALQHGVVPPNLHFRNWNPNISPAGTRFFVPTEPTDWPVQAPTRLAAVSSFGFSGTNAHIVLAVPAGPVPVPARPVVSTTAPRPVLVPVSSTSTGTLTEAAGRLAGWLSEQDGQVDLADVAHTLAVRRSAHRARLAVVAGTVPELVDRLRRYAAGGQPEQAASGTARDSAASGAVWVFSGQGSQWAGMGRRLLAEEPAFAATIAELEPLVEAEAGFSLAATLRADRVVDRIDHLQLTLFSTQVALAAVWRSHGLRPAAVIGHSMGEVSAAVVAGVLSLPDGVRASYRRARQLVPLAGTGAMASVDLPHEQVAEELRQVTGVTIAVISSPRATVVTGDPEPVRRLVAGWQERGQLARFVASDVASHGAHLDPYAGALTEALRDIRPRPPEVPFYSTVTDDPRQPPAADGAYWADNLRKTVRFASAVRAAADDGHTVFLEVSVHPIVGYAMRDILAGIDEDTTVAHTIRRDEDTAAAVATQLAGLYCAGVPIDLDRRSGTGTLLDVPATTWRHTRHWIDLPLPHPARRAPDGSLIHPLLGTHTRVPEAGGRHVWQADLGTAALPWLADHQVEDVTVLPGTGYCELALAAGAEFFDCPAEQVELSDVRFRQLLPLDAHTTVFTSLVPRGEDGAQVEVLTRGEGDRGWTTHASARVGRVPVAAPGPVGVAAVAEGCGEPVDVAAHYAAFRAGGYHHGPAFAALTGLRVAAGPGAAFARIGLPAPARTLAGPVRLHPVLLDAGLQTLLAAVVDAGGGGCGPLFPVRVGSLRIFGDTRDAAFCHATVDPAAAGDDGTAAGTLRLLAPDGTVLVEATGVGFAALPGRAAGSRYERLFHEVRWMPAGFDRPAAPRGGWLLVGDGDDPLPPAVRDALAGAGRPVTLLSPDRARGSWDETLAAPADRVSDVVLLVAGQDSDQVSGQATVVDRSRDQVMRVVRAARALAEQDEPVRLWLVTTGVQNPTPDEPTVLAQAGLRGLGRVVMCEYPRLRTTLVDVGPGTGAVADLVDELFADSAEDEIAWRDGQRYAARLVQRPISDGSWRTRPHRTLRYGRDGIAVDIARPGDLDTLGLVARPRRVPGAGEVEIRTAAVGLNFADVMTMLDMFPVWHGTSGRLGLECAGTVERAGAGVTGLRPGDRVMAFHDGTAATFVTAPAELVAPVPAGLPDVQAAGLPAAYLTAWYALTRAGRLAAGERVLIHAGTGGVGLAAIAIARSRGAQVLATAGSERKRAHLRELGVEHVMDSRSLDFVPQTLAATGGQGVDLVLNSLSGAALFAGLDVLNIGGRFVEIGKRDIYADAKLGMLAFRRNIAVASVDLALLGRERRPLVAELLAELGAEFAAGRLGPLPCAEFALPAAADALRYMAAARHIGKLVLAVPQRGGVEAAVPAGVRPVIRPGGGYLITGGLGGLGLELARWLAGQGAGRIVLAGRSAPSERAGRVLAELRAGGTEVEVVRGDIAAPGVAGRLVAAVTAGGRELRGVLHAAAVLDDCALSNMDEERLDRVWQPKVAGAWRLHEATREHELDWFVLFSSMAALLGSPGQGNYSAANDWLDAFARWRRARGLPALSVNWGAWGQAGRATGLAELGYATFSTADGLRALEALLDHERTNAGAFSYDPEHWFQAAPTAPGSAFFAEMPTGAGAGPEPQAGAGIVTALRAAAPERRIKLATGYVADSIRVILGLGGSAVEPGSALPELGFDSLTALQLRNRLEADLAVKIPATVVWSHPTPASLAEYLLQRLNLAGHGDRAAGVRPNGRHGTGAGAGAADGSWFRTLEPRPRAGTVLYCFPHAGGAASTYRPWLPALPERLELRALQLPGREDRADQVPPGDFFALVEGLATVLAGDRDPRPFAFFGHSGGGLLAFETARALRRRGAGGPVLLGVSAMPAPQGPGMAAITERLFREQAPEALEALADIPAEVRRDPALFALAQRALHADYMMYRGYRYRPAEHRLDCRLAVFGGDADPLVRTADLDGWREHTTSGTTVRVYPGDHFYLRDHIPALAGELAAHSCAPPSCSPA